MYVVVPIIILLLLNIITGVVIFLLTRHCYRKKRDLENTSTVRFNPHTDCIQETFYSELHAEKPSAGNVPVGVYADVEAYDNPSFSLVENEVQIETHDNPNFSLVEKEVEVETYDNPSFSLVEKEVDNLL